MSGRRPRARQTGLWQLGLHRLLLLLVLLLLLLLLLLLVLLLDLLNLHLLWNQPKALKLQIGRASCRERV